MNLLEVISRLIEASEITRRERKLRKTEIGLEGKLRRAFLDQGKAFLAALPPPVVQEAAGDDAPFPNKAAWTAALKAAQDATEAAFVDPLEEAIKISFVAGTNNSIAQMDLDVSFTVENPRAVEYARTHAAENVTNINKTTEKYINTIVTDGVEAGKSYNEIAKEIRERYEGFSKDRAKRIAVFETGDAYEEGGLQLAESMAADGLEMEKSWLTVGDSKVRAEHAANQAQGWIPLNQAFQSGDMRSPTDPGCRCSTLYRVKPLAEAA